MFFFSAFSQDDITVTQQRKPQVEQTQREMSVFILPHALNSNVSASLFSSARLKSPAVRGSSPSLLTLTPSLTHTLTDELETAGLKWVKVESQEAPEGGREGGRPALPHPLLTHRERERGREGLLAAPRTAPVNTRGEEGEDHRAFTSCSVT